jgi:nucleotide-binding universal stress UspA family protein
MTVQSRPPRPTGATARRIVVGVADSASGHAAVRWAADRAAGTGAAIALLHVEEPGEEGRVLLPRLALVSGRDLLARETRFVRSIASDATVTAERLEGSVMWALGSASAEAAMVVVGTHKSGFIHGAVYGSTSLQLAATARCPVVVVPAASLGLSAGIVLGADGSPAGRAALQFAASEADRTSTDLLIVRVLAPPEDDADDAPERAEATTLLDEFRAAALASHPGLVVEARVIHGSVAHTLVTMSTSARLLVLGDARTDAGRDTLALGAVCHDALLNIQSPTVIVHVGDLEPNGDRRAAVVASVQQA